MRQILRGFTIACALLSAAGVARPVAAQPFTLNEQIKPTELKLEPYRVGGARADGRMYGAVVTQTQAAQDFFVRGVSIYSPDYVGVTAEDPSARIQVLLHKETWEQPNLKGQTDSSGHWDAKFKTSSDFGIHVVPDHIPATYAIVVWVGNEVDPPFPSPFEKTGAVTHRASFATVFVVAGGLVALALAGFALFKQRRVRLCILIACLAGAPFIVRPAFARDGDYASAVAAMLAQLKSFLQQQESAEKFWQALKTLSADEASPNESQRGPTLPSSCVDNAWTMPSGPDATQGCQCMATAVDKLRKNRQMLEKMRVLVANQKAFVDKATALGNSYAQLHTLMGLQWVGIKRHDIDEPYAQFKVTSNQKHQQLMAAIQKDVQDVGACEAKLGERDWYQKFGFMYYEFLYAAYKPSF